MNKNLDFESIFKTTWHTFRDQFKTFAILALFISLLYTFAYGSIILSLESILAGGINNLLTVGSFYLAGFFLLVFVQVVLQNVAMIFAYKYQEEKNNDLRYAFVHFRDKFWRFFFATILVTFLLIILYLLLIIPGIIFTIYWMFVLQAIYFRDQTITNALKYSKELVTNNWWRSFAYILILAIIFIILLSPISLIELLLRNVGTSFNVMTVFIFVSTLLRSLASYFSVTFALNYFLALEKDKAL